MAKYKETDYGINFKPVNMKTDYELTKHFSVPFKSFRNTSAMLILGPSCSGKSTKVIQLFQKNNKHASFYGLFNEIILCSPSLHTIDEKDNVFKDLPPENIYTEFNEDFLKSYKEMMEKQKGEYDELHQANMEIKFNKMSKKAKKLLTPEDMKRIKIEAEPKDKPFNCLILDDCGNKLRKNKALEDVFNELICNRRHHGVCGTFVIVILQNTKMIGPRARDNLSHVLSLAPSGEIERHMLFSYTALPQKEMNEFYRYVFSEPRATLFIDKTSNYSGQPILYRNFKLLESA